MSNYHTKIVVQRTGSGAVKGIIVRLGFESFLGGGMTPEIRTDANGVAIISHTSKGTATLYVDGKKLHKITTPCEEYVMI